MKRALHLFHLLCAGSATPCACLAQAYRLPGKSTDHYKNSGTERSIWLLLLMALGCPSLFAQNAWTPKADFFEARQGAASFTINNKLYVGTGNDKADLWEYNPSTNVWTQKANLPAGGRSYATGFSIGNKGYIATGSRTDSIGRSVRFDSLMSDVWEYDPAADSWTQKADFGGGRRARAVAFTLNDKAYVGSGQNLNGPVMSPDYPNRVTSDFWVFDPAANTWSRVGDIPMRRTNAIAFSSHGKGFVGTGFYNTYTRNVGLAATKVYPGDNLQDLWAYDADSNTWSQKKCFSRRQTNGDGCVLHW